MPNLTPNIFLLLVNILFNIFGIFADYFLDECFNDAVDDEI